MVKAKIPSQTEKIKKEKEKFLNHLKWFKNDVTEQIFKINTTLMWNKKNCAHLMRCNECGKKYVGEMCNTLATRFYQHKHNIL